MSLRLIYGRAGTGKSQLCFNEISDRLAKENKIYIITPEQFSFTSEQKLLNSIKQNAVINAEVITFNRMAYRVSRRGTEDLLKQTFLNLEKQCLYIAYYLKRKMN